MNHKDFLETHLQNRQKVNHFTCNEIIGTKEIPTHYINITLRINDEKGYDISKELDYRNWSTPDEIEGQIYCTIRIKGNGGPCILTTITKTVNMTTGKVD
jgi:hypothetical protein